MHIPMGCISFPPKGSCAQTVGCQKCNTRTRGAVDTCLPFLQRQQQQLLCSEVQDSFMQHYQHAMDYLEIADFQAFLLLSLQQGFKELLASSPANCLFVGEQDPDLLRSNSNLPSSSEQCSDSGEQGLGGQTDNATVIFIRRSLKKLRNTQKTRAHYPGRVPYASSF